MRLHSALALTQAGLRAAWQAVAGSGSHQGWAPASNSPELSDWDALRAPGADTGWRAQGFAEAQGVRSGPSAALPLAPKTYPRRVPNRPDEAEQPFPSIGPHGHRKRMREKLLHRGADALADYELLEMLLFFAFKSGDTKPFAKSLINRFGSLAGVITAPTRELLATRGLGQHSVAAMKLVQAVALRLMQSEIRERPLLNNWDALIGYLTAATAHEKVEQFRVLFLDTKNRLLADEVQGRGTVNHAPVYPREVVKRALELHATALILVHNHPSGDPSPSRADIEMTAEVKAATKILGIALHDHLIIGGGQHVSMRREGLL